MSQVRLNTLYAVPKSPPPSFTCKVSECLDNLRIVCPVPLLVCGAVKAQAQAAVTLWNLCCWVITPSLTWSAHTRKG